MLFITWTLSLISVCYATRDYSKLALPSQFSLEVSSDKVKMKLLLDKLNHRSLQVIEHVLEGDVYLWSFCADSYTLQFRYLKPEGFGQQCAQVYLTATSFCDGTEGTCSQLFGGTSNYPLRPLNDGLYEEGFGIICPPVDLTFNVSGFRMTADSGNAENCSAKRYTYDVLFSNSVVLPTFYHLQYQRPDMLSCRWDEYKADFFLQSFVPPNESEIENKLLTACGISMPYLPPPKPSGTVVAFGSGHSQGVPINILDTATSKVTCVWTVPIPKEYMVTGFLVASDASLFFWASSGGASHLYGWADVRKKNVKAYTVTRAVRSQSLIATLSSNGKAYGVIETNRDTNDYALVSLDPNGQTNSTAILSFKTNSVDSIYLSSDERSLFIYGAGNIITVDTYSWKVASETILEYFVVHPFFDAISRTLYGIDSRQNNLVAIDIKTSEPRPGHGLFICAECVITHCTLNKPDMVTCSGYATYYAGRSRPSYWYHLQISTGVVLQITSFQSSDTLTSYLQYAKLDAQGESC